MEFCCGASVTSIERKYERFGAKQVLKFQIRAPSSSRDLGMGLRARLGRNCFPYDDRVTDVNLSRFDDLRHDALAILQHQFAKPLANGVHLRARIARRV